MKIPSLLKSAAVYSATNIMNAAIPFLLLPVLTRVLSPSGYGVISMFNATLGVIAPFTGLSVHGAVGVRFVNREETDFPRYVGSCICILLFSTMLTLAVVTAFGGVFSRFASVPPFWIKMAVVVSLCSFLVQIRLVIWQMEGRATSYGAFQIAQSAVNCVTSVALVVWLRQGYEGRLWGVTLAGVLFASVAVASLLRKRLLRLAPSLPYVKEALAFGLPIIPHTLGIFLMGIADRFVINQRLGVEQAGVYMVAVQLGLGIAVATDAFNNAFVPWLYRLLKENDEAAKLRVVKGTWLYFAVALCVASAVALSSYWIIYLAAGPKYTGAAGALAGHAFAQAFGGMYLMVTNYIFYARRTRPLALVTFVSGGLGIALTWFLIPICGIAGAGISLSVTMLLRFLLTWALAQRVHPMPWFSFGAKQPTVALDNEG